jgi:hypothetical protein
MGTYGTYQDFDGRSMDSISGEMMGLTYANRWARRMRRAAYWISFLIIVGSLIALPVTVASPFDGDPDGGTLLATRSGGEVPMWTDTLDDLSDVYAPEGMENVKVADGEARLLPGFDSGWLATSVIGCPDGFRYDFVLLEVDLPGNSSVEISILNASRAPSMSGYANETVPGLDRIEGRELALRTLDPERFPSIRIQVNLLASGTDRPRLLAWSLYYSRVGEWRDDFVTGGKLLRSKGTVLSGGTVTVDTSSGEYGSASRDHRAFPPVYITRFRGGASNIIYRFYPNTTGTGYGDRSVTLCWDALDIEFVDADRDGYYDLVCANNDNYKGIDSQIWWGRPGLSRENADSVDAGRPCAVTTGDCNGDGWPDLAFSAVEPEDDTGKTMIFLNQGGGVFNYQPDLLLPPSLNVQSGDLNGDGYDDLVAAGWYDTENHCYLGGPQGLSTTADLTFTSPVDAASYSNDILIYDLDDDGHVDVVVGVALHSDVQIFMGSHGGVDTIADQSLSVTGYCYAVGAGDINGDGHTDLVLSLWEKLRVYEGTATGWSDSRFHDITPSGSSYAMDVLDVDHDGFDDIVLSTFDRDYAELQVCLGNTTWPTTPSIRKTGIDACWQQAVMAPKRMGPSYVGTFDTEAINLPKDHKWVDLTLDATIPEGTTVRVSVLDGNMREIHGLADLTNMTVDLSEVLGSQRIHVRVTISTPLNTTSPVLDSLVVTWRELRSPLVQDMEVSEPQVYRTGSVDLTINITDEHDAPADLQVAIWYRKSGGTSWNDALISDIELVDGRWTCVFSPSIALPVGMYDFRVRATDTDGWFLPLVEFPGMLEVLNNLPTAPVIDIEPEAPLTTSVLTAVRVEQSVDIENPSLTYRFRWYRDGELVANLTGETVPTSYTSKGENWSVEVRAFDGDDEGPPGIAWRVVSNAAPQRRAPMADPILDEDTVLEAGLDLTEAFEDPDLDDLEWSLGSDPQHLVVEINATTGLVTIRPEANWSGTEEVVFIASDGEYEANQTVKVTVRPVNDAPWFVRVDGKPVPDGPVTRTVKQGEVLEMTVEVLDNEDDELAFGTNSSLVEVDPLTGTITFRPGNGDVGTHNLTLKVHEAMAPDLGDTLTISIVVENVNDEMDEPVILRPGDSANFEVGENFTLEGMCHDPDLIHGQVLEFSWSSNVSGLLGTGPVMVINLTEPGTHNITLTVSDGDYERSVSISVVIIETEVPPPPDDVSREEGGIPLWLLLLLVLIIVGVLGAVYVIRTRGTGDNRGP